MIKTESHLKTTKESALIFLVYVRIVTGFTYGPIYRQFVRTLFMGELRRFLIFFFLVVNRWSIRACLGSNDFEPMLCTPSPDV